MLKSGKMANADQQKPANISRKIKRPTFGHLKEEGMPSPQKLRT